MIFPQIIQSNSIELRRLREEDQMKLYQLVNDPLIWEQHPESNRYQWNQYLKYFDSAIESNAAYIVHDKIAQCNIGCTRFYNHDLSSNSISIGYTFLIRTYWGTEYNHLLKNMMLDYIFQYVEKVTLCIWKHNIRSQKSLERYIIKNNLMLIKNDINAVEYQYTIHRTAWNERTSNIL